MAGQAQDDVGRQIDDAAASWGKSGGKSRWQMSEPKIWSRRLVYLRQLDADRLLGCIQVHTQPAAGNFVELHHELMRRHERLALLTVTAGGSQARQSQDSSVHRQPL